MGQNSTPRSPILNYVFTGIVVIALIAVYLLTGQRGPRSETAALTPAPAPTATPFGRPVHTLAEELPAHGLTVERTETGYTVCTAPDAPHASAELTVAARDGTAIGFTLSFPAIEPFASEGDLIGNAVAALLEQQKAEQAAAMETILSALFSAYDAEEALPVTVRTEWIAMLTALQAEEEKENGKFDRFHFTVFPSGSGAQKRLICTVLYD